MAQNIGVIKTDEEGNEIKRSQVNFAIINKAVYNLNNFKEKYQWLSTIDEYGDTTFNYLQIPYLISELDKLKEEEITQDVKEEANLLVQFIKDIESYQHIKFIGD